MFRREVVYAWQESALRRVCVRLRVVTTIAWQRLYIRHYAFMPPLAKPDEFHRSLDSLPGVDLVCLSAAQRKAYYADLIRRREIAHQFDIPTPVADLAGTELDYWVARAEGLPARVVPGTCCRVGPGLDARYWPMAFLLARVWQPSREWRQAGPIVEKRRISLAAPGSREHKDARYRMLWQATAAGANDAGTVMQFGSSPAEAAMRCRVAMVFGKNVSMVDGAEGD